MIDIDDINEELLENDDIVTEDLIKEKIPEFTSEKLCQIIVANRYLNYSKDLAVASMLELSSRRENGSNFNYESYIEESLSSLPKLDFSKPDLRLLAYEIQKLNVVLK
jgi:hypothetical protein